MSEQRVAKPKSVLTRIRREARIFGDCIVGDVLRESAAEIERLTRELDEQCRLHGKGSEREARQLAEIERLTRDLADEREQLADLTKRWGVVVDERDRLRDVLEDIRTTSSDECAIAMAANALRGADETSGEAK